MNKQTKNVILYSVVAYTREYVDIIGTSTNAHWLTSSGIVTAVNEPEDICPHWRGNQSWCSLPLAKGRDRKIALKKKTLTEFLAVLQLWRTRYEHLRGWGHELVVLRLTFQGHVCIIPSHHMNKTYLELQTETQYVWTKNNTIWAEMAITN